MMHPTSLHEEIAPLFPPARQNPHCDPLVFEWEAEGDDPDFLRWQGDIDALLGFPAGSFPRTFSGLLDAIRSDERDVVLNAIQAHLVSDEPYQLPCHLRKFNGEFGCWTHSGRTSRGANGQPVTFFGSFRCFESHESEDEAVPIEDEAAPVENEALPVENEALPVENVTREEIALPSPIDESSAEERVREEQARAQSLLRVAAHLNAQLDLQEVCEAICEEAGRTLNAPSAVMLFNRTRDAFVPAAVRGMPVDYDKRYIPTLRSIYDRHVAQMGTLFLFTDAQATPDLPNHALYQEVNMRTIGIASLIREGEVLGLLKVYSFGESRIFNQNELALLQGLADQAAQAIANARLLAEAEKRLANIHALREIDKAILGTSDVGVALGVVLDQVVSRLGADAASALLLNPHTRTLRYASGRGFRTDEPRRSEWQLGEGLAGRAALERRLIHVPDLSQTGSFQTDSSALQGGNSARPGETSNVQAPSSPRHNRRSGVPQNEGFASYFGVPLIANGHVQGVLEMWHRAPTVLDEEELEFLETLAGQAAIAVDNAHLFRDLQRSNDELVLAYDSTLAGWSGALDLRDKETEGHSERVTRETLRLAQEMGLSDAELVHIRRGALLHDIGKMGVPDAILLKPGPLSDEEWVIMRQHPGLAHELLSPIEYLRPALDIPYAHHEKWDGSGYPRGLSGEQIPRAARLFAVVDVWDALSSDRPYRKGWPIERVLNHIRDGAGQHFDPAVVEAFLHLHKDDVVLSAPPPAPEPAPTLPPAPSQPAPEPPKSWPALLWGWLMGDDAK